MQGRAQTIAEVEKLLAALMSYGKVSTSIILEETTGKKLIDLYKKVLPIYDISDSVMNRGSFRYSAISKKRQNSH